MEASCEKCGKDLLGQCLKEFTFENANFEVKCPNCSTEFYVTAEISDIDFFLNGKSEIDAAEEDGEEPKEHPGLPD